MNPSCQGPQYGTRGRFQPYQFRTARGKENFTPRGRGKKPVKRRRTVRVANQEHKDTCTTFVFNTLPLIYPTININHSTIVSQLKQLGVANISVEIAKQKQGFAGRLKLFKRNWENICIDRWVLHAIQGYQIEWLNRPHHRHSLHCPRFSQEERVSGERNKTNAREAGNFSGRTPLGDAGFPIKHFSSAEDGGHRPIINLKKLNEFIPHSHFKMEGIHMLKDLLRRGDFLAKIDLKDTYFAVPISTQDRKYLRFRWGKKTFQFNCLPYGLSCAPWVFTKITKAAVSVLREMSIRLIIYIDDILVMAESETLLRDHVAGIIYLLENLGFVINFPKSLLEPTKVIDFLGFLLDSSRMELKLPGDKTKDL